MSFMELKYIDDLCLINVGDSLEINYFSDKLKRKFTDFCKVVECSHFGVSIECRKSKSRISLTGLFEKIESKNYEVLLLK